MKRRMGFSLALLLAISLACRLGATRRSGWIIYQSVDEKGTPQAELVVIEAGGKELHRIAMPALVNYLYATAASGRALCIDADGKTYLINAKSGQAQPLDLQEEVYPDIWKYRFNSSRWNILSSPSGDLAYLLDLKTARVTNLMDLSDQSMFSFSGSLSPDEKYLLFTSAHGLWLVPTGNPASTRQLGQENATTWGGNFSPDSKRLAYVQRNKAQFDLVVEAVDGSSSAVVSSGKEAIDQAGFGPGQNQLTVVGLNRLYLLDLTNQNKKELLTFKGLLSLTFFAPNGKRLLFSNILGEHILWTWVNLQTGEAHSLPALTDFSAFFYLPDREWLFFVDTMVGGQGSQFSGFNLETGQSSQSLTLDEGYGLLGVTSYSADGRYLLIEALAQDKKSMQLWFLDLDTGKGRKLAENTTLYGSLSSDSRWALISSVEGDGDQRTFNMQLMSTTGDETKSLGRGYLPIWVKP